MREPYRFINKMEQMELFIPGMIGNLVTKNRIIMSAMGNGLIEPDGRLSERAINFYVARAKGGAGLIITCAARTRLIEKNPFSPFVGQMVIDSKRHIGRLNELAEAVHDYGAKVCVQVTPGQGRNIGYEIVKSGGAVGPSILPTFADSNIMTRKLTISEIRSIIKDFKLIAEIIRQAEIDAIEINAHGGYLCDQFMTPLWNKRSDEYGGNLENRLRFLMELIESLKRGAGNDFPIIVKYALTHYFDKGRDIEEGLKIAQILELAGIEALNIDAGCYETAYWIAPPTTQPAGCMAHLAERVKKVVSIPVIAVGKLQYPRLAERLLQEKKADFIALGRAFLADPEWPNKVKAGKLEDICPCVGDNECRHRIHEGKTISCSVNPKCGMEKKLSISLAEQKKSVLIVGGGPSGMELARVASIRGHNVTLCEKGSVLGGNLIAASATEAKNDYRLLINYLSAQVKKRKVKIKLKTLVTEEFVRKLKPEVVFISTGAKEKNLEIPGVHNKNVFSAISILSGDLKSKGSVIVIGGGAIGCEVALFLAEKRESVKIVEMSEDLAEGIYPVNKAHLLKLLDEYNIQIYTKSKALKISDRGVVITDKRGRNRTLEADSVITAVGLKPDDSLLKAIKNIVSETYAIGDCVIPKDISHAIRSAYRAARLI